MSRPQQHGGGAGELPRPGRTLRGVLLALLSLWVVFAVGLRWGGADPSLFLALAGNTEGIASGQLWRLLTAPLMHAVDSPWHLISVLLGLYFLTPSLEAQWSSRRLLLLLWGSGVIAYAVQALAELSLPPDLGARLSSGHYYGGLPVVEAVAVAWALHFRGQTVRLMFVLPVSAKGLLAFVVGLSVLRLIAVQQAPEGLIAPFGGLAAGYLLGGGTPSPLRRAYLKARYRWLQGQSTRERQAKRKASGLRVIEGGAKKGPPDPKDLN